VAGEFDMVHSWSGVSEELFTAIDRLTVRQPLKTLLRGSAHIETQHEILLAEEQRCGVAIDRPSEWIRQREAREYQLADYICCLSGFARRTFLERGIPDSRMVTLPLGVNVDRFRPVAEVLAARRERVLRGEPLRVLMVGTLSFRKGLLDYAEVVRRLAGPRFQFRFVGDVPPEGRELVARIESQMTLVGRVEQRELAAHYAWGDLFLFPTLEDGFAAVLSQALAAGLPLVATPNCSAPDLIEEGEQGWLVPIRSPEAMIERLTWCDSHREELVRVLDQVTGSFRNRPWSEVASNYLSLRSAGQGLLS
jgi:glycosyltransferase involved in cell wall biosynthesis